MPQTVTYDFYGWPPNLLYKGERHDEEYPGHGPGEQQDPSLRREDHTGDADGPRHHYPLDTMTAQGEYLLAWLETAIAERERVARDACSEAGGAWREDPFVYGVRDQKNALVAGSQEGRGASIVHIAANDPESVVRRCAADRKLLELHSGRMHSCPAKDETGYLDEWTQFGHGDTCPVVQLLAEGYGWTEAQR